MTTQKRIQKYLKRVRDDYDWYCRKYVWIRDKNDREILLAANKAQRKVDAAWDGQERAGKPVRLIILKARKLGASTRVEGRFFHRAATRRNQVAMVVAHDEESAIGLFDMVKLMNDKLPDPLRPMQRYSNRRELVFENPSEQGRREKPGLRSRFRVATANNVNAGRSRTPNLVHLSEAAFYRDLAKLHTSIRQSVADTPNTAVVIESSPNGVGDPFQRIWEAAKQGRNDYAPVFIAWYDADDYAIPFASKDERRVFLASLTEEEKNARKLYGLSPEQLHWRREKMRQFDDPRLFFQEYPENDVDCFLSSSANALPSRDLMEMRKGATEPKKQGYLDAYEENGQEFIRFKEQANGPLSIWKFPEKGEQYIISADPSEGITGGNPTSVDVLNKRTGEQVAQWHGIIAPDLLGSDILPNLGWYYNTAMIAVERENHGHTVLAALKKVYSNIYRTIVTDKRTNQQTERLGWITNRITKPQLRDELALRIRERSVIIKSVKTIDECLTFVRKPDGTYEAQEGCLDDRVMSLGINLMALKYHPYTEPPKRRKKPEHQHDSVTGY